MLSGRASRAKYQTAFTELGSSRPQEGAWPTSTYSLITDLGGFPLAQLCPRARKSARKEGHGADGPLATKANGRTGHRRLIVPTLSQASAKSRMSPQSFRPHSRPKRARDLFAYWCQKLCEEVPSGTRPARHKAANLISLRFDCPKRPAEEMSSCPWAVIVAANQNHPSRVKPISLRSPPLRPARSDARPQLQRHRPCFAHQRRRARA